MSTSPAPRPLASRLRWALLSLATLLPGCAGDELLDDPRAAQIELAFARGFLVLARSRPRQLALRLDEMSASPHRFLRGTDFLYTRDLRDPALPWSRTDLAAPRALIQGDAHVENVGTFAPGLPAPGLPPQRVELNDFDAAGFAPPHWEVRRAAASLLVALREAAPGQDERALVSEVASSYAAAIAAGRDGPMSKEDVGRVIGKRLDSAAKDGPARAELESYTELRGGERRLRRGGTDPQDPREALIDAPPGAREQAPAALAAYRATLAHDEVEPRYFDLKDIARRCGQGVGSLTSVRLYALVEGPGPGPEDDVLLQLKEATDASLDADLPLGAPASSQAQRVVARQRALQSTPGADPRLGYTRLLDLPMVVSGVTDAQKTVRLDDLAGRSPEDLRRLAADLGELLARAHNRGPLLGGGAAAPALRAWLAGREAAFIDETAAAALAYADQVVADHRRFMGLRARLGPLLGLAPAPAAGAASAALAALDSPCP